MMLRRGGIGGGIWRVVGLDSRKAGKTVGARGRGGLGGAGVGVGEGLWLGGREAVWAVLC